MKKNMNNSMNNKERNIACIAFSDRGYALAKHLASVLGGRADRSGRAPEDRDGDSARNSARDGAGGSALDGPIDVRSWTAEHFHQADALIYVGAAGIAVRAIAPHLEDKTKDPAVVVMDERALHVIPILSGHLGGANDLARRISAITGSDCVITTATDVNGVFAVDEWSKRQNCVLLEREKIMHISGTLLAGGRIGVYSRWPVTGEVPGGIDLISIDAEPYAYDQQEEMEGIPGIDTNDIDVSLDIEVVGRHPLHLVPRICVLGVGCRRGTSAEAIEELLLDVLEETCVHPAAIRAVASIDLKKDEPGLTSFCAEHGWELLTYSSEQLQEAPGTFTPSAFVTSITGVDNVCERAAVLACGGELIQRKTAGGGVTLALAAAPYQPDWIWQDDGAGR